MTAEPWTIYELSDQVAEALSAKAPTRADGRVREVPDPRTIRWYQTTGLVDRPSMRGRTALYGERHLLQLLAIKHLQGRGEPLAQIQAELAGASDDALARLAGLTLQPRRRSGPIVDIAHPRSSTRARFWVGRGHPSREPQTDGAEAATPTPDAELPTSAGPSDTSHQSNDTDEDQPPVSCFRLHEGVILVIDGAWHRPGSDEATRLHAAAQPLLDALEELDLLPASSPRYRPDPPPAHDPGARSSERPPFTKEQA